MNINDYYLDTKILFSLPKEQAAIIDNMFNRLVDICFGSSTKSIPPTAELYFNTLSKGGYLKNKLTEDRDEKIEQING